MPKSLDSLDRRILDVLQGDGRLPNAEVADRIGLSATPCLRRIKALEGAGVIRGYRAEIDRRAVGLGLTVMVGVKVDGHRDDNATAIQEAFRAMPEVVSCHLVSGEADFLLEVVVPDLEGYEAFLLGRLLTLPMVKDVRSNFVIRTVKERAPLPLDHL
ncbi:Lrp/AsnC family transcriptional regulator [Novispirillum sp. DQ9]|uniref:Lrp/AsnC family transcriptional regulator n=1 Tax=Novispirillum sp. DQ9 TaxID=3398612 RepID=UPI003C7ECDE0